VSSKPRKSQEISSPVFFGMRDYRARTVTPPMAKTAAATLPILNSMRRGAPEDDPAVGREEEVSVVLVEVTLETLVLTIKELVRVVEVGREELYCMRNQGKSCIKNWTTLTHSGPRPNP